MPTCPNCGSTEFRFREKRADWFCDGCDRAWVPPPEAAGRAARPLQIFLSYGHDEHTSDATRIKDDLEKRGHKVWFDDQQLRAGCDWEASIEQGLRDCDLVVLLMTPHAVRRRRSSDPTSRDGYCLNEVAKAIEKNKIIVPVLLVTLEDGPPTSICRIQYLEMTDAVPTAEREERYRVRFERLVLAIEENQLDFGGGQARLQRLLRPLDFGRQMERHIASFTGRLWLLADVDAWLASPTGSRVLWLRGGPGIGKSAIATHLCHRRGEVIAHHFCVHGDCDKASPTRAILSIAFQMATHLPEYYRRLQALSLEEEVAKNPATLFDRLVLQPLARDFPAPDGPRLVIIDALDEATRVDSGNRMQNAIAQLVHKQWQDVPSWLRLFITSRPEAELLAELSHLDPLILDARRPENLDDIRAFLATELSKRGKPHDEHTLAAIIEHSEGVFLYATELLKEIDAGRETLARLHELPHGMNGHYRAFFGRQMPDLGVYHREIRPILECISAACEPLSLRLLQQVTGVESYDLARRLDLVGSLFPIRDRGMDSATVAPFHKSVRDWLVTRAQADVYTINLAAGQKCLAYHCWRECMPTVTQDRPLRDPFKSSYACRHGLNHLVECRRYGQAVELLDYLVRNEEKFESGQRPDLDQFAKLITSALGGPCPPTESEAKQVEPHKLARLIQGLYMTDPLYGGIRLIVEHNPVEWPEILEDLLATDDYVLRHTISEVLADSYAELGKPSQLEEILKLAEHPDINHRELGSYALGLVYAEDPTCIEPKYLNLLAEGETYPFRSVLGDLLLSLALQDKDNDSSKGVEMIKSVAPSSHFWNPLWDFNRMDVDWLKAVDGFVRNQQPSAESPDSVRRAYDSLVKTEKRRQDLLQGGQLAEAVASSLKSYYQLGVKEKEIRKAQSELKSGAALAAWCEVLFAHPLWEVTESAASVLASIVDEKPDAAQVISELFDHDLWRVQFGAAEAAFLARFKNRNDLFCKAVRRFYRHPEPLLRGNCAENLTAWILDSPPAEQRDLLAAFQPQVCYWIQNNQEDCWVLDHVYRLFRALQADGLRQASESLLSAIVSPLLEGEPKWYQLDRQSFLRRIEERKRSLEGGT